MNTKSTFKERLDRAKRKIEFAVGEIVIEFTEQVGKRMRNLDINKAQLSDRLKTSPAYVTKMLKGEYNFTIETMVKLARALESDIEIRICPKNVGSEWFPSQSETVIVVEEKRAEQSFAPLVSKEEWRESIKPEQFNRQPRSIYEMVAT